LAAGEPEAAHVALVERIAETRTLELAGADLIVTGPGRPLDVNLYQSIKPLVALEPIVDRRTVVVLLSGCSEGVGSEEMLLPFDGADGPDEVVRRVLRDYTVEKDHSYFVARFLARCPNVVAWCPGVSDGDLARFGFEPARDLEDALGRARRQVPAGVAHPEVLLFARPQRALLSPVRGAAGDGSD
jgi:lactate racemase